MIHLDVWASPDGYLRLKDWSGQTKGGVTTVTIRVEIADPSNAGYMMKRLAEAEAEQLAMRKPIPKQRRLPPPEGSR